MQIVYAKICGWAYGFMITHSPVKKGAEVLYDYGQSYCECSLRGLGKMSTLVCCCQ